MFCNNCGHEIAPDTSFCANCGTPVSPQQQQSQQPPQQLSEQAQQPTPPHSPVQPPEQTQQPTQPSPVQQQPEQAQQPTQATSQPSPVQQSPQPSPATPYSVPNSVYTPGGYAEGPLGTPKKKRGWLIAIIVIATVVVFTLIFALIIYPQFVAKDKGGSDKTSPDITNEETIDADDDADIEDEPAVLATDPALENYLAILKPQLNEIIEQSKTSGMTLDISARGSAIVYTYTYLTDIGDIAAAKAALELSADLLGEASKLLLTELETAGVKSPSVIYEYVNSDGTMIFSQEFK